MKATIKSLHLENFKGVKNATYQLDGKNVSVIGQNGAGKTTIFTAYMWLVADKDSDLKNNPNIRPLDTEECTPRVEVVFDIDGKEVTAAKIQKRTVKKSKNGGADTVSLSNSYEVNSVEYGERDFKKKMTEYGFDFDLFLPLSHPDVFTSQKSVDMRKVLFGMASEKSDYEIATNSDEIEKKWESMSEEDKEKWAYEEFFDYEASMSLTADLALLLKNYTTEEVKAMQNATLRKIREEYGKDGEILRAKIEGMEQSKTDIDVAELELQKNALNEQIAENKAKQEDISKEFEEQQKASDGIIELKFELNDLQRKVNEDLEKQRREIRENIDKVSHYAESVKREIQRNKEDIERGKNAIDRNTALINVTRNKWKVANEREFDDSSLVCSYCGQLFQEEKQEEIRAKFAENKAKELAHLTKEGNELKSAIDKDKSEIEQLNATLGENEKALLKISDEVKGYEEQLGKLPQSIDISDRPEVQEINRQIAEKEAAMNKGNSAEDMRKKLKGEEYYFQSQLTEVEKQLALAQKNAEIDEKIAALRKKQSEFEQNRANAEKILDQLDLVSRKKNELLTDEINRNFDLVDFKLFDWQKNGEYKEVCIPTYRNKDMGTSTNTGLEILMKLDIIKGLQRHYNMFLPVFVDGGEALSEGTMKMIDVDCQLILLKVTEDKELRIETEV